MRNFRASCLMLALAASLATPPANVLAAPLPPGSQLEDRAKTALLEMSDYLKASKSYSFHADIQFDDVLPSGQKIAFSAESDISLRRPNGIYASQVAETGSRQLWFDGKQLTLLDPDGNTFAREMVSGNTDQALEHMIKELHFTPPLADFLYEDPAKAMFKNTIHGFEVGMSPVEGIPCRHLAFVDNLIDWQIWIEAGKLPVPRKLVITYKTLPNSPQFSARLTEWDFNSRLPDSRFRAIIPAGAVQLPFMKEHDAAPQPDSAKSNTSPAR
jgi:hypothetical protein